MTGTKRKIEIAKRDTKAQRSVAFSKRRRGLFQKAADLCLLSGASVAVLATPPSDKPDIYSFGHSSVDNVIEAFLSGGRPSPSPLSPEIRDFLVGTESGLGFWLEDQNIEDLDELRCMVDRVRELKNNVAILLETRKKRGDTLEHTNSSLPILEAHVNASYPQLTSETQINVGSVNHNSGFIVFSEHGDSINDVNCGYFDAIGNRWLGNTAGDYRSSVDRTQFSEFSHIGTEADKNSLTLETDMTNCGSFVSPEPTNSSLPIEEIDFETSSSQWTSETLESVNGNSGSSGFCEYSGHSEDGGLESTVCDYGFSADCNEFVEFSHAGTEAGKNSLTLEIDITYGGSSVSLEPSNSTLPIAEVDFETFSSQLTPETQESVNDNSVSTGFCEYSGNFENGGFGNTFCDYGLSADCTAFAEFLFAGTEANTCAFSLDCTEDYSSAGTM